MYVTICSLHDSEQENTVETIETDIDSVKTTISLYGAETPSNGVLMMRENKDSKVIGVAKFKNLIESVKEYTKHAIEKDMIRYYVTDLFNGVYSVEIQ